MVSVSLRIGTPNVDMRPVGHGLPILQYRRTLRYGRTARSGELSGISRLGVSMQYIKLGTTGLDVSPVAIGAMTYGDPGRGHPVWSLGEDESRPLIKHAIDSGINFFDTANMYSQGSSEEILGRALRDFAQRDQTGSSDALGTKRKRLEPQGNHDRDRSLPAPPRHRLRRSLSNPSQRPHHPARRNLGGTARPRQGRQGSLPGRIVYACMGVRQGATPATRRRLGPVRVDAEPSQPARPRRGTRNDPTLPRRGGGVDRLEESG